MCLLSRGRVTPELGRHGVPSEIRPSAPSRRRVAPTEIPLWPPSRQGCRCVVRDSTQRSEPQARRADRDPVVAAIAPRVPLRREGFDPAHRAAGEARRPNPAGAAIAPRVPWRREGFDPAHRAAGEARRPNPVVAAIAPRVPLRREGFDPAHRAAGEARRPNPAGADIAPEGAMVSPTGFEPVLPA